MEGKEGIQAYATEIVTTLTSHGHIAYFAGGYVRDALLGIPSSDIDIATSAEPREVAALFPRCVFVGEQFGVVVVTYKGCHFEIATFRKDAHYIDGRRPTGVTLKSAPREDAQRRDFTINGMFFDPISQEIIDFVEGKKDLEMQLIRTIGDPEARFGEDRLRMIRAVRFAHRFGFAIEEGTRKAIKQYASTLREAVSRERIWQELVKIHFDGSFANALVDMAELTLLGAIFSPLAGVSPLAIRRRLRGMERLPLTLPTILMLARLFTKKDSLFLQELPTHLRCSRETGKWLELFMGLQKLAKRPRTLSRRYEWAHFLASPRARECLEVYCSQMTRKKAAGWMRKVHRLEMALEPFIVRIRERTPLVSSRDLMELGVTPGKRLGALLREAEKIAITYDLMNREAIIARLKTSTLWRRKNNIPLPLET